MVETLHGRGRSARMASRAGRAVCWLLALSAFVTLSGVRPPTAQACGGVPVAIPVCAPTISVWKAARRAFVSPTFNIPISYTLGIRTPGCASIDRVEIFAQIERGGTGPGAGTVVGTATDTVPGAVLGTRGFNFGAITVPVSNPTTGGAVPEGLYNVQLGVTLILTDGSRFRAGGDTCVAVVEPASDDPGVPRLDIERLNNLEDGLAQPNDAQVNPYRITNNDPDFAATVVVNASNRQNARLPVAEPTPPFTGGVPFSFAQPNSGDHFPIRISTSGGECIDVPAGFAANAPQEDEETFVLAPGESMVIDVISRADPLCRSGSGCEQIVEIFAQYEDGSEVEVCAGGVTITDLDARPQFECDLSGTIATFEPNFEIPFPSAGLISQGLKGVAEPRRVDLLLRGIEAGVSTGDDFVDVFVESFSEPVLDDAGRFTGQVSGEVDPSSPGERVLIASVPIDLTTEYGVPLPDSIEFEPIPVNGFEGFNPSFKYSVKFDDDGDGVGDWAYKGLFQLQANQVPPGSDTGEFVPTPINLDSVSIDPLPGGAAIDLSLSLPLPPAPPTGGLNVLLGVTARGFVAGVREPEIDPADFNRDGVVNQSDIFDFLEAFASGDPDTDVDGDGLLTFNDIVPYLRTFDEAG